MINGMILILILLISRSLMAMSLNVPLMVYIYLNLFALPEHLRMLLTSINRFKRAGYSLDIMRQTACLVFNPIMVEGYAALFSCTAVVHTSDSMTASM